MNYSKIEVIPAVIKGSRPSQYEGESFTALEYVSKIAYKMNECITEYNKFIDEIIKEFEDFKSGELITRDVFERKIEQMVADFIGVIELKYKNQDKLIDETLNGMIENLPNTVGEAIKNMYDKGEFDQLVYNSIANLKTEFDVIVKNTNSFQQNINSSFNTLREDVNMFKTEVTNEMEGIRDELTDMFENLETELGAADMMKSVYDTNGNGVVDNSEKLGGQPPEYYAKKQEYDNILTMVDTLDLSVATLDMGLTNTKKVADNAYARAQTAINSALDAVDIANEKMGKNEKAVDSDKLDGKDSTYFAPANHNHTASQVGAVPITGGDINGSLKITGSLDIESGRIHSTGNIITEKMLECTSIELTKNTPYIDFKFGNTSADYSSRIIEDSEGHLTIQSNLDITGSFTNSSDARVKNNIEDIDTSALFDALRPVSYYKNGSERKEFGFIAQEVVESMRLLGISENELDLVHHNSWKEIGTNTYKEQYSIGYLNIIAMLVYEVQQLKSIIKEMEDK